MRAAPTRSPWPWGRCFVSPAFDGLVIGGGLSLVVTAIVLATGKVFVPPLTLGTEQALAVMPILMLATSSAHFAASTVRLYTKPGTADELPALTALSPLIALAALALCLVYADTLGSHLQSLYLTWSPYHYAAQAYGLSLMYALRTGCALDAKQKRTLRIICLLPFAYALAQPGAVGLGWLLPATLDANPTLAGALAALRTALKLAMFAAPLWFFARCARSESGPLPVISVLIIASNGIWWAFLAYSLAFVWAAVFHALQYLAISVVFHVEDQAAERGGERRPAADAARFYGMCLLLAFGLFHLLPQACLWAGFGYVESLLLVVAAINVHHFVVDAFIWRLRRGSNRRIVTARAEAAA